jgi:metal-dependent amidase/aminoacylase/carboxypeptidase family protein
MNEVDVRSTSRIEVIVAVLLGVAAVVTAWSSFQSGQLSGRVQSNYSQGIRIADEASQAYNTAVANDIRDRSLFLEFAKAAEADDEATAQYVLQTLMSPELAAAVEWWSEQPDESGFDSPFVDENPAWSNEALETAQALDAEAQSRFDEAKRIGGEADDFERLSVVLALALFFLGIAGLSRQRRVMLGLAACGSVIVVYALVRVIVLGDPAGLL